ncbi:MAG: hypothetical protein U0871_01250 [Gemmataceae bacterium]
MVEILTAAPPTGRYLHLYKCKAMSGQDRRKHHLYDHTVLTPLSPAAPGLEIPPIPPELDLPVRALVRSAAFLEAVEVAMAEGMTFREVADGRLDLLEMASKSIEAWQNHLGIEIGGGDKRPWRRSAR